MHHLNENDLLESKDIIEPKMDKLSAFSINKTKWIWIYDREKRQYSDMKDHKVQHKAIKRP